LVNVKGVEKMRVNPTTSKHKKRVIKWENVICSAYAIITLFKYFITSNPNILFLIFDLTIDACLGQLIYKIIYLYRKKELFD